MSLDPVECLQYVLTSLLNDTGSELSNNSVKDPRSQHIPPLHVYDIDSADYYRGF